MAKPSKAQQCPRYTVGKRKYRLPNPKGLILLFYTYPSMLIWEFSSAQLERKNKEKKKKKKRKIRYPKNYDPALNALPDPERWLPKRERSYYKSILSFVGMLLWLILANQGAARRTWSAGDRRGLPLRRTGNLQSAERDLREMINLEFCLAGIDPLMPAKQIRHNNKRPPQPEEPKMCLARSKAAYQEESVEGRKACEAIV